ncbi:hypothetical protein [Quatrionicoccus australiensis]|uniref:hypothetical protein n=1 Tax=Quatrionicoccus australiensis TaxID=138118 RepID=UPI001CF8954B|nr:hypothetical protein [Quatrionicoccus australiensis]UCV13409.1 hypothetical protein KI612_10510 [Quatrionicoccus australiensis]
MANLIFQGSTGFFDHRRLVEDLLHSADLFNNYCDEKLLLPPASFMERLGDDLLHATIEDRGAWDVRKNIDLHHKLDQLKYISCFNDGLDITWLMAVAILGRKDLRTLFAGNDAVVSFERGIAWLVLHGANEHDLYCKRNIKFIAQILNGFVCKGDFFYCSPLEKIIIIERPDIFEKYNFSRSEAGRFQFVEWIKDVAVSQYNLYWLFR